MNTDKPKLHDPRDSIKAIAMDIGKDVAHHIEIMYPEAVEAASSTFLLSIRNSVYNRIVATFNPDNVQSVEQALANNAKHRKLMRALVKNKPCNVGRTRGRKNYGNSDAPVPGLAKTLAEAYLSKRAKKIS